MVAVSARLLEMFVQTLTQQQFALGFKIRTCKKDMQIRRFDERQIIRFLLVFSFNSLIP
ncbi:MAG: hypothetical protein ACXVIL_04135 [Halobacteriota archaeon]